MAAILRGTALLFGTALILPQMASAVQGSRTDCLSFRDSASGFTNCCMKYGEGSYMLTMDCCGQLLPAETATICRSFAFDNISPGGNDPNNTPTMADSGQKSTTKAPTSAPSTSSSSPSPSPTSSKESSDSVANDEESTSSTPTTSREPVTNSGWPAAPTTATSIGSSSSRSGQEKSSSSASHIVFLLGLSVFVLAMILSVALTLRSANGPPPSLDNYRKKI